MSLSPPLATECDSLAGTASRSSVGLEWVSEGAASYGQRSLFFFFLTLLRRRSHRSAVKSPEGLPSSSSLLVVWLVRLLVIGAARGVVSSTYSVHGSQRGRP